LTTNPNEEFEKIITVPLAHNPIESARETSLLITCEDDQQFLQRNVEFIEKEDAGLKGSGGAKKPVGDLFDSLKKFGGILNQSSVSATLLKVVELSFTISRRAQLVLVKSPHCRVNSLSQPRSTYVGRAMHRPRTSTQF